METVNPLDDRRVHPVALAQLVVRVNALDQENLALELDLAFDLGGQLAARRINLARLQRAPEGPGQSATGGCYHVVESRRVGREVLGIDAVMIRDRRVHAEGHLLLLGGKLCFAQWAALALDRDLRDIDDLSHGITPLQQCTAAAEPVRAS